MKVATKLTGAFGAFIVLLAGLLIFQIRTIRHAVRTNFELSELSSRVYTAATRQIIRIGALEENAGKYLVTRDPGYLEKFVEARIAFEEGLHHLDSSGLSERERAELGELRAAWPEFLDIAAGLEASPTANVRAGADGLLLLLDEQVDRLRFAARSLGEASQEAMEARLRSSAAAARHAERISWGVLAGALLIGVLGAGLIVRSISEALRRLQEGTREVAAGNFHYRLYAYRDDEFAQLSRDFNVMTRRLGELDQMKKDFLSKVSHDLKTPLASMQETTRALLEEVPGPLTERQQLLLQLNHQSGERLSAMIAKILELSALEAGALGFEPQRHDLVMLARRAIQEVELAGGEYDVELTTSLPAEPLPVFCDGDRISRVLVNLLENAVKFSPRGGEVHLALEFLADRPLPVPAMRRDGVTGGPAGADLATGFGAGAAVVTVRDAGPGIPDAEKEMVFERFYQAEGGKRIHRRGVGLGLTICREIVTAHQGALWVDDTPGGGCTFSLVLPWGVPAREPSAGAIEAGEPSALVPARTRRS
jgi:two-component system sensor histidine kinase GlrK